jgi:redox-sensitive bicupin YhaK (pirin superfamily)
LLKEVSSMITLRPSDARGHADHGWLQARHSFSFADYWDPRYTGWGNLRVLNEDRIAPRTGFGMHGHRDMEIITIVLAGVLTHRDSLGHRAVIRAGDVQRMSAGRGIRHSEVNEGPDPVHLLQIWIEPTVRGIEPSYEQRALQPPSAGTGVRPIARPASSVSSDAAAAPDAPLTIHADAALDLATLHGLQALQYPIAPGRCAYVHVVRGSVHLAGRRLGAGDAAMLADEPAITLSDAEHAVVLLFDLAPNGATPVPA